MLIKWETNARARAGAAPSTPQCWGASLAFTALAWCGRPEVMPGSPCAGCPSLRRSRKPALGRLSAFLSLPKNMNRTQWKFETYKRFSHGIIAWVPLHEGLTLGTTFLNIICIMTCHEYLKSSFFFFFLNSPVLFLHLLPLNYFGLNSVCMFKCSKQTESKMPFE